MRASVCIRVLARQPKRQGSPRCDVWFTRVDALGRGQPEQILSRDQSETTTVSFKVNPCLCVQLPLEQTDGYSAQHNCCCCCCCWRRFGGAGWSIKSCQSCSKPAPIRAPALRDLPAIILFTKCPYPSAGSESILKKLLKHCALYLSCLVVDVVKHFAHARKLHFSTSRAHVEGFLCRSCGGGRWV